ncbi:hypothetical protein BASA81_000150 [Batrachochytrium salamandrivorans]|nr:hypothetical protein BASA81_000150 [Batrachochytrium salamandrivorans]
MAFLFLFLGAAVGASVMSLSEMDRNYYYDTRYQTMRFLGTKDGAEIWQNRSSGVYYVDDGWDVKQVGMPGFVPHPVDRNHLKMLCDKFNPEDSPWVDFLLTAYEGQSNVLWERYFDMFELGPKPSTPTWGKGIRKARWANYERELELWEAKRKELSPRHKEELQMWEEQKQVYNEDHVGMRRAASGAALLQRALSSNNYSLPSRKFTQQYKAVVPPGYASGDEFLVKCSGKDVVVPVPAGARPGDTVTFLGPEPAVPVVVAQPVVSPPAPSAPSKQPPPPPAIAFNPPPPAITSKPLPPPVTTAPPPAITAPPPPGALPRKSSMKW